MKKLNVWLLMQLWVVAALGQYNLKGNATGEGKPLPGASIVIENTFYGTSANSSGNFQFRNLKEGKYKIVASFIGYETTEAEFEIPVQNFLSLNLKPVSVMTGEVLISATRAKEKTPVAYTNIDGSDIARRNMGQDIPYLLQLTPSFVATSDAGAGVGYTNFRIRGTDLNRINVTVNGIPLNDPESHGTWFVDQPDLASSLENVQIQRGVGTSTNGAASFGATINLQTNSLNREAYAEYHTAAGSVTMPQNLNFWNEPHLFNTFKNSLLAGTGLINGKFTLDARLSKINSDGFIDRAFSDLKSFFVAAGYYSGNTHIKVNIFSGIETTYQAWNGVPSVRLNNDTEGMLRYGEHWLYSERQVQDMLNSDSRTYNIYNYENQVDNYQQDHYQLHFSHRFNPALNMNASAFYIRGLGYYENFKEDEDLEDYMMPVIQTGELSIESTNLVNRKWLDNHFYGTTYSLNYNKHRNDFTLGGGGNNYDGHHYGNVIWAQYAGNTVPNHEWYRNKGTKSDFNIFAKNNFQLFEKLSIYADIQFRGINYQLEGIDDDLRDISQNHRFSFFNPKFGIFYNPADNQKLYASYAVANREPNRSAYVDANPQGKQPVHETLYDQELGYEVKSSAFSGGINLYHMSYNNQLVLTGEINDVGAPIMVNVDDSYRTGIELQAALMITRNLQWQGNATFSRNKINKFTEHVDNWDTWSQEVFELGTTDIAFSPRIISNSGLLFEPVTNLNLLFVSSYVGKQYIDNTSSDDRRLDAYLVNNLKADYSFRTSLFDKITLHLMVNNIFNEMYESNAWVYSYILDDNRYKMDGYFPQAGRHFMIGVDFRF